MDLNVQAFRLVQAAVEESPAAKVAQRDAAKHGGIKGGAARAASLSPARRKEIALAGSMARWSHNKPAGSAAGGSDR